MKYLFVCTGNTCRSPIAEALMNKRIHEEGKDDEAFSRGLAAGEGLPASSGSQLAARGLGADLSCHKSHQLTTEDIEEADIILTMSQSHKTAIVSSIPSAVSKTFTLGEYSGTFEDIPDPYGGDAEVYRKCADTINKMIGKIEL